jgi:hypothetical protein
LQEARIESVACGDQAAIANNDAFKMRWVSMSFDIGILE